MKMNKENLQKQVETMNKKQLICLCKSLIDIYCELEDRIDKAIEYIKNHKLDFKQGTTTFGSERLTMEERKLIDILRGEDDESN